MTLARCTALDLGRQGGAGIIEVMVALVILAIGLLGIAGLQLASLQHNHSAALRSNAIALCYDALDRMRANRDAASTGEYTTGFADPAPGGASIAAQDLQEWKALLASLPSGAGEISSAAAGGRLLFTVTVQWDDSRGAEAAEQFQVVSEL
jgi:type IV pilus assembly protein PilV